MCGPTRLDYRDRYFQCIRPFHRVAWERFRNHGILLPFGHFPYYNHTLPNKFILHPEQGWVIPDSADPLQGWNVLEVFKYAKSLRWPANDIYGHLYAFVRKKLEQAVNTLERLSVRIELHNEDAVKLCKQFAQAGRHFDRIETSNLADQEYVGLEQMLKMAAPLLNAENPKNTLIVLLKNWFRQQGQLHPQEMKRGILGRILKYFSYLF